MVKGLISRILRTIGLPGVVPGGASGSTLGSATGPATRSATRSATGSALALTISLAIGSTLNLTIGAIPVSAANKPDSPVHIAADDGPQNTSFVIFRTQLIAALKKHDKVFLEDALSPDIGIAIGGGKGKKAFLQEWQELDDSSPVWSRLERVVSHGAQFDAESGEFHSPSLTFEDSHSELPQGIVWNKGGTLRKEQTEVSAITQNLYGEQLTIVEPPDLQPVSASWVKIKTNNGAVGYMKSSDVYSAYDEFAVFKERKNKWYLTWFGFAGL